MRLRNVKFYSIYFLVIISYIIIMGVVLNRIDIAARGSFNFYFPLIFTILVWVTFGFILGFDQLHQQWCKDGKWYIDSLRLLCLGLPCLILIIWNLGPFLLSQIFFLFLRTPFPPYPLNIILHSKFSLYTMTIVIGYVITTSFYKEENIKKENNEKPP